MQSFFKKIVLPGLLVAFWLSKTGAQQPDSTPFRLLLTLPVEAVFAEADNLGHTYIITSKNAVEKYAPDGRLLARFSNVLLGPATWVNATNPLKIMVFYENFRVAVFLDRNLTQLGMLDLNQSGFQFVRCLAPALDGNVWVYDEADFQLKKITPTGQTIFRSQAMNLLGEELAAATQIVENDNQVFLSDSTRGVFAFDSYAQFLKFWPVEAGVGAFEVEAGRLFFLKNEELHVEQFSVFQSKKYQLPAAAKQEKSRCRIARQRLFVLEKNAVQVFAF